MDVPTIRRFNTWVKTKVSRRRIVDPAGNTGFPLPTEITLLIFRWATDLVKSPRPNSLFNSRSYGKIAQEITTTRTTMFSLLRVCKAWYPLAMLILMENIAIRKPSKLKRFLQAMRQTPIEYRSHADVLTVCLGPNEPRWSTAMLNHFMDVLPLLPNPSYLRMHWFPIPDALHRDFVAHIAHHLPRLTNILCHSGPAPGLSQLPISSQYMLLDG